MNKWTNKEIVAFDKAQTLKNRPYNNDKTTFEEDNQVFIRGAKGVNDTKWYQAGTQNGGQIEVAGQKFEVEYQAVNNAELIKDVTEAFNKKYHGQYPIDLMVSDPVAQATVALVKK
ncbi:DUF2255 family protein [Lactobacillus gasseri]|uniref:DUF2255 family protein n=1 Tax=Lactobacillus gasseri TaxID=1596 RepID=UPI000E4397F3|nr:DUF2255 family protein [Lactobacillus gasseri]MCT7705374.1 DUF2255 family protein [Lactobacillus gasseri]MCZ3948392.1 DUF2255 family protein [Lactobacillus gasseri]RGL14244.1 DUF2255 family protein [Lactobacillus gasseri]